MQHDEDNAPWYLRFPLKHIYNDNQIQELSKERRVEWLESPTCPKCGSYIHTIMQDDFREGDWVFIKPAYHEDQSELCEGCKETSDLCHVGVLDIGEIIAKWMKTVEVNEDG